MKNEQVIDITERNEHVFFKDDAPKEVPMNVTYVRVLPEFRAFVKLLAEKHKIHGVVISEDELNFGFIIEEK